MNRVTEDDLTAEVVSRLEASPDPRLRDVMSALVRHLHAFTKEVRLTDQEWLAGIRFLTATGHITDDVRQEFILLSDTLGLSSLVDLINHSDVESLATEPTILGPFYVPESPHRDFGASMVEYDDGGEPAVLHGTVRDENGQPIPGATLDVWQNAATGSTPCSSPRSSRRRTSAASTAPTSWAAMRSAPSARCPTRFPLTAPSATCWPPPDATRGGRRTSTPGCRPPASNR